MAEIAPFSQFAPEAYNNPIVGVSCRLEDHDSGEHSHLMGQLLFTSQGCVRIRLARPALLCMLPPTRIAWIPPGIVHHAKIRRAVDYRSVYIGAPFVDTLPSTPKILAVTPLLRELLIHISLAPFSTDWSTGKANQIISLCLAEIRDAAQEFLLLPLPSDRRLAMLGQHLERLPPALHELAQQVGACERTIARMVRRDTGMSYQEWRQQWKLIRAVEMLNVDERLSTVAQELGFTSDSAFIAFFRGMTGTTPKAYCRQE
ncbi:AraC family transcriptional regulator [Pseudomonas sp. NPDC086278]|uniref:AraC family transcriptional regulator n=1 Tax=Pseudomonas sp. NPDC086278 TaxID=3390646 RepID=UPI003D0497C7